MLLAVPVEHARGVEVMAGDGADPVGAEELLFIEHPREDPLQPMPVYEREDPVHLEADLVAVGHRITS